MTTETVTHLVTLPFASRRGARSCRTGAVVALATWALLWSLFVAGIAAPAGRLAGARGREPVASLVPRLSAGDAAGTPDGRAPAARPVGALARLR